MKNQKKTTPATPTTPSKKQKTKKLFKPWIVFLILTLSVASCGQAQNEGNTKRERKAYVAQIIELNPELTKAEVSGKANFVIEDDNLNITVVVKGVAPNIMHMQHLHGFLSTGGGAFPRPEADTNRDGIIDLFEAQEYTGTTLIPLNGSPVDLEIKSDTYPIADKNGLVTYQMTVPLDRLEEAIKTEYRINKLELDRLVILIHGVPAETKLPNTVQSLPGVPAHMTVPIACGVLKAL